MHNTIKQTLILSLFFYSSITAADCRQESEIPSSTPDSRFTIHSNGTVTDNETNLMWAKCALGQDQTNCSGTATGITWQGALQAAESSTLATYTDWRVPNLKELRSIVEKRCYNPSINAAIFPNTSPSDFWSASPDARVSGYAWVVDFGDGNSYVDYRSYNKPVRLVRSGQ